MFILVSLTGDGPDPASPTDVGEGVAVTAGGMVHCHLGKVLKRT